MSNTLSLIIPCYNEVDNVGKLRDELFPVIHNLLQPDSLPGWAIQAVEVIFVDDGSKDGTGPALQEAFGPQRETAVEVVGTVAEPVGMVAERVETIAEPVGMVAEPVGMVAEPVGMAAERVGMAAEPVGTVAEPVGTVAERVRTAVTIYILTHLTNRGLGAALRTGFAAATGDLIVTTDSDGTYSFAEIPTLLSFLTPGVDIVTASPYHAQGAVDGVPGYRLVLSKGASAVYRLLSDRRVHTYTALFRAYRHPVIKSVPFHSDGFLGGTELLVNAMRMGYRVVEYPTVLHSRVHGQSKAKLARTIQAHLNFQAHTLMPWHPYGTVIRGSNGTIYLYVDGEKRPFPLREIFLSHGYHYQQIVQFSDAFLDSIPTGSPLPFRDGTLLRGSDKTVYVIEHGRKRAILSAEIFISLGYQWQQVMRVADSVLTSLENGPEIVSADRHPDWTLVQCEGEETVYVLDGGRKRPFPSAQVFFSWNYTWNQVQHVSKQVLVSYPLGPEIEAQPSFNTDLIAIAATFTTSFEDVASSEKENGLEIEQIETQPSFDTNLIATAVTFTTSFEDVTLSERENELEIEQLEEVHFQTPFSNHR